MATHGNEDANVRRYPTRDHIRSKYLDDYVTGEDIDDAIDDTANCTIDFCYRLANVPQSYQDVISSPEANKWRDAMMREELNALWDNETYELTPLPEGRTSVGGKWVYAVNLGPNGEENIRHVLLRRVTPRSQVKTIMKPPHQLPVYPQFACGCNWLCKRVW